MLDTTRCVVLNSSYEPLSVISAKRGLILVIEGKATVSEAHPTAVVRSITKKFPLPIQIVLKDYVKSRPAFRIPAQLTQRNLFVRDKHTCQYCGRTRSALKGAEFLTRDHIVPSVRGGKDEWTNVVTACNTCNNKKADYTLTELLKMGETTFQLAREPRRPTVFEIWTRRDISIPNEVPES